jgi:hypothetical protein
MSTNLLSQSVKDQIISRIAEEHHLPRWVAKIVFWGLAWWIEDAIEKVVEGHEK